LFTLNQLLDQAYRWWCGENVSPVTIRYVPQNSGVASIINPYQDTIIGPGDEEQGAITLDPVFHRVGMTSVIENVQVSFKRYGQWLLAGGDTATDTNANDNSTGATFGASWNASCPLTVSLAVPTLGASGLSIPASMLFVVNTDKNSFTSLDPSGMSTGTGTNQFVSSSDTTNKAANNILSFTPIDTAWHTSNTIAVNTSPQNQVYGIYAVVKNASQTTDINVYFRTWPGGSRTNYQPVTTPVTTILGANTQYVGGDVSKIIPQVLYFGSVALVPDDTRATTFQLLDISIQFASVSGQFQIERIVVVGQDDETANVLQINPFIVKAGSFNLVIAPNTFARPTPSARLEYTAPAGDGPAYLSYNGNASLQSRDQHIVVDWLCVRNQYWRLTDNSANVLTVPATITRDTAYPVPR
jgi:hypothetical protein